MAHPLVLGLFGDPTAAAAGARALRDLGVSGQRVSVVARSHDEEVALAREAGASPGSEIEDSAPASRLGELGGHLLAAIAVVMPGIGPIVADGPLAAELGEAAGHLAGGMARTLERAGMAKDDAQDWEVRLQRGACLVGAHVEEAAQVPAAVKALSQAGAVQTVVGTWVD